MVVRIDWKIPAMPRIATASAVEESRLAVVRGGPKRAADPRVRKKPLEPGTRGQGDGEDDDRQHADRQAGREGNALRLETACRQGARVRGEELQQQVLDDDRQAEGHDQRRQRIA
jgi:hypothetical protein